MTSDDLVTRAHWGGLTGQNWAALVRLSVEVDEPEAGVEARSDASRYMTGRDIKGRDEQEKDCRDFVERRGGTYVHTYEEPDTSAWKRKRVRQRDGTIVYRVIRPVFEGALEDLKRGVAPNGERLDGLIVYDIDRLTRDNRHLEDAIDVVENFRRPIIDISGTLDLLTENGQSVARLVVTMANKQSAASSRRVRRKHRALEQAGIPTGGARPFGWQADKRTLDPDEAEHLRDAVRRLITGGPLRAVVIDWNERGITTPRGNKWTPGKLKRVLRNPRICGYRSRAVREFNPETGMTNQRVEIVYDPQGNPVVGQWEPVISVAEWQELTEIIGSNDSMGTGHNARKYLLTGILRCGEEDCGGTLRAMKASRGLGKPEGFFYYTCPDKGTGRGCSRSKVVGTDTDDAVVKLVILKYEEEAAKREAEVAPAEWPKAAELDRVREDIDDLKQARKTRKISASRYFSLLAESEAEERALLKDRNLWRRQRYAAQGKPVNLREDWPNLTLVERRAYIEDTLSAVIVAPAAGRRRPARERLIPVFRDDR